MSVCVRDCVGLCVHACEHTYMCRCVCVGAGGRTRWITQLICPLRGLSKMIASCCERPNMLWDGRLSLK